MATKEAKAPKETESPAARGIDPTKARELAEAWRAFARVEQTIEDTPTGWQVATRSTQVEYVTSSSTLIVRQGIGPNYNAPITDPEAMRARLATETAAQKKLLREAKLDLAVLPYRHLDPLHRNAKPTLEIVVVRTVDEGGIEGSAFVELVKRTMKAGFDWRKKRDLLFRAGR